MTISTKWALAGAGILMAGISALGAANAQERITYKSAKSGTSYYQMGVELANAIKAGTDGAAILTVEESQGSVQNVMEASRAVKNLPEGNLQVLLSVHGPAITSSRHRLRWLRPRPRAQAPSPSGPIRNSPRSARSFRSPPSPCISS